MWRIRATAKSNRYCLARGMKLWVAVDCKTVRIFAYSSKREQSNKRSGTNWKYAKRTVGFFSLASHALRACEACALRALPISLLILRKKPTVLQSRVAVNVQDLIQFHRSTCIHCSSSTVEHSYSRWGHHSGTSLQSLILPDEWGHLLAMRNRVVLIKRCTTSEVLNQFIVFMYF